MYWRDVHMYWTDVHMYWRDVHMYWRDVHMYWRDVHMYCKVCVKRSGVLLTKLSRIPSSMENTSVTT
jgi:hypothetical protein